MQVANNIDSEADVLSSGVAPLTTDGSERSAGTILKSEQHDADRRFNSEADLKTFLQGIQREEARGLIYGTVLDLAMSDVVTGAESPL